MEREDPGLAPQGWTGGPGVQVPEERTSPMRLSIRLRVLGPSSRLGIHFPRGPICLPGLLVHNLYQLQAAHSPLAGQCQAWAGDGGRTASHPWGCGGAGLREARAHRVQRDG